MTESNGQRCRCGEPSIAPYCASCGRRQLDRPTIDGLLAFVVKTREAKRTLIDKYRAKAVEAQGADETYWTNRAEKNVVDHERWSAWCKELEGLIKSRTDASHGVDGRG